MCTFLRTCEKSFLFITNVVISLLCLTCIGLSIWVLVDTPSFLELLSLVDATVPVYTTGAIILLVVSIIGVFLAGFGCCGAMKENRCLLGLYSLFLFLMLGLAFAGTIIAFKTDFEAIKKPFLTALEQYDPASSNSVDKELVKAMDAFQQDFECCGVESWKDWQTYNCYFGDIDCGFTKPEPRDDDKRSSKSRSRSRKEKEEKAKNKIDFFDSIMGQPKIPESCCDPDKNQHYCARHPTSTNGNYYRGCYSLVAQVIEKHAGAVGGVALAIIVIMIFNFFASLHICTSKPRYNRAATK